MVKANFAFDLKMLIKFCDFYIKNQKNNTIWQSMQIQFKFYLFLTFFYSFFITFLLLFPGFFPQIPTWFE